MGRPVRIGLIGAGKFGSMILAQARFIEGYHIVGVADLDVYKARGSFKRTGWDDRQYAAPTMAQAVRTGTTCITDDVAALLACDDIECIIEATGHPLAGTRHALAAIDAGKHVIMVNVEADVLCGAVLANRAAQQGVVYSMAYGDQPAAICLRVRTVRRGQGHELCPALPLLHPRHGLGLLRLERGGSGRRRL